MDDLGLTAGQRIRRARDRIGMSRKVLGDVVGRSDEWVKAIETDRLLPPRLPMLLKIARALDVTDLAELTGTQGLPVEVFTGPAHGALAAVRAALTDYQITPTGAPPDLAHLAVRLDQAWAVRHGSPDHRTQLGSVLPGLIRDAQRAVRAGEHPARRDARRLLARVYQLADFFVAYQPAPELVWMVADRAMAEAREADDPYLMGSSAWALIQPLRDAGRWEEAIVVAQDAAGLLEPRLADADDDWLGLWGALQFEAAYVHARRGRAGEAWRHWDRAGRAAARLPAGYRHLQSSFSPPVLRAHAVTIGVELRQDGEALRAARFDASGITSIPRRSRHLVEVARAHHHQHDLAATLATLDLAERTAPETVAYNGYARRMALELLHHPPAGVGEQARDLAARIGIAA